MAAKAPTKPTVLVVEDEMLLRMRAVDIVEDAGFIPLEAVNADDALALLEARSDIELLFGHPDARQYEWTQIGSRRARAMAIHQDYFSVWPGDPNGSR